MTDEKPLQRPVRETSKDSSFKWMGLLFVLATACLLYYKYGGNITGVSVETPFDLSVPGEPAEQEVASVPEPESSVPERLSAGSQMISTDQEPADLDSSDPSFEQDLASELDNPALVSWLGEEELIRKTVAVVDNAARGRIPRKLLNLPVPNEALQVKPDAPSLTLDQQNYARYDDHIRLIMNLDGNTLQQLYVNYQPLLQQAYAELGNPNLNFDDALATAFQVVLDTPEISGPLSVQRVEGRIVFVDQEIEALPDLQKLLIRMGPDHRARVKRKIAELQSTLFADASAPG